MAIAGAWVSGAYAMEACSTASHPPPANDAASADAPIEAATALDSGGPSDAPSASHDATVPPEAGDASDAGDAADANDAGDAGNASDAGDASGADALTDGSYACPTDGGLPAELSCTGLYADWATKTVSPSAIPYTPGFILWSDGAVKSRWISLPPNTQIDTTNMDDWVFPVGTKIWKQFALGGQLVETRLLWKQQAAQWTYADYRWASDGSSAPLLTNGEQNVNGTTYEIPSLNQCPSCHGGRLDAVLGFDIVGTGVPSAQGLTLAMLAGQGLLTQPPPSTAIAIPEDSTMLAAAALGWLHVNCGVSCHNANPNAMGGPSRLYLKLLAGEMYPEAGVAQVSLLDSYTTSVGVLSNLTPNGQHYLRIAPGDAGQSLIPLMDTARGDASFKPMPPIVSNIPDTADVAAVMAWINAL